MKPAGQPTQQFMKGGAGRASRPGSKKQAKQPLSKKAQGSYGTSGGQADQSPDSLEAGTPAPSKQDLQSWLRWLETSDDTDPSRLMSWCCDEFKPRKIKAPLVLAWVVIQALGILFQCVLLGEISSHLYSFEETLNIYCNAEHKRNGICLGPAWNLSYTGTLTFPPSVGDDSQADFDFVIPSDQPFAFEVASTPPTFLIGIDPQPPHEKASWKVTLGPRGVSSLVPAFLGSGSRCRVVESKDYAWKKWTGAMTLRSKYPETVQIQLYVVDSRIKHLDEIHKQPQCTFEDSWQNFNEHHNAEHHKVLQWASTSTTFFLSVSLLLVGLTTHRFFFYVEGGKLLSRIIAVKFVMQDIPQQMCIIAYLYAWYANNGLRCQMCLFHPEHCDDEHPLHWTNFMVAVFTMISSCANQLLVQAKVRRYRDEEDECFLWFARGAIFSVSILPFSTAVFFLSSSLLHLRSVLIYFMFGIPTLLGWGACLCVPAFAICDEDD
eukprot:TRINITY_DN100905_c0_g1_i1.p1 TRINITY_DN100905_c0_g1~~TRINITY_DN100905_c0_g1_i1.p1  ORF type:complete len:491 (+),score=79.50 TRINITY_DN100905_c0_g1_i1:213-1685(+)